MKRSKFPFFVLLPMMLLLIVFIVLPIGGSFVISFFDYNPLRAFQDNLYIGLRNFSTLISDELFHKSLLNTLYYVFVMVGINLCFTLIVSQVLCTLKSNKWRSLFRVNFFMPCVAPLAAVAIVWLRCIFPARGALNMLLGMLNIPAVGWLDAGNLMTSLLILSLWADVGYNIVLFIAGIEGIPGDYYEAAEIDGANAVQRFFKITLPLLGRTLSFVIGMTFISQFQAFAQFSIIAFEGGPGRAGYVLSTYIYNVGFRAKDMGYASAVSIVLFFLILIVTAVQRRLNRVDWGY